MIYITGDCHQDFERFNIDVFSDLKEMTKDDCVIICGDFGGVWNRNEESSREAKLMDWLENRPFTTLFVDGNHENFDRLYAYPVEKWHGGKVHKIRPSVIHLLIDQNFFHIHISIIVIVSEEPFLKTCILADFFCDIL